MLRLRLRADLTAYRLRLQPMGREQALQLIERTRVEILELFPGKGDVFDLVLRPRFLRILNNEENRTRSVLRAETYER
jgi:hypothetical protein